MLYCRRGDNMPRQKSGNFDQNKYVGKYHHENVTYRRMNLSLIKQEDKVIAAWIDQQGNASKYIRSLIEADMKAADPEKIKQAEIAAETDSKYQPRP